MCAPGKVLPSSSRMFSRSFNLSLGQAVIHTCLKSVTIIPAPKSSHNHNFHCCSIGSIFIHGWFRNVLMIEATVFRQFTTRTPGCRLCFGPITLILKRLCRVAQVHAWLDMFWGGEVLHRLLPTRCLQRLVQQVLIMILIVFPSNPVHRWTSSERETNLKAQFSLITWVTGPHSWTGMVCRLL